MQDDRSRSTVLLDEMLSVLYEKREANERIDSAGLGTLKHGEYEFTVEVLARAVESGFVEQRGGWIELTAAGLGAAQTIVRCARLAERLLVDVLRLRDDLVEPSACRLEHNLSEEVADSICTLLGHPKTCPHGHAIPPGGCCRRAQTEISPIIKPLSALRPGEEGNVAYVSSRFHGRLIRLASLGLMPGQTVKVKQVRPSFVVGYGEMELAVERDVADEIYVRVASSQQET